MTDGFPNKPRILRGAFVEFGLSLPPLLVVFQFNPLQLTRNRALTLPAARLGGHRGRRQHSARNAARVPRRRSRTCSTCRSKQLVTVQEQTIGFDIRLDATDKLDDGDAITEQFGIAAAARHAGADGLPRRTRACSAPRVEPRCSASRGLQLHPRRRTRRWCCSSSAASGCCR